MEEKQVSIKWIRVIGILLQIGSVIAVLVLAIVCLKRGDKDFLIYDRAKRVLLPPRDYANVCPWLFWAGFAGGMMVVAHEILREGETITKGICAALGIVGLLATIYLNAFLAYSMYVDEGLGFRPTYETVGEGEEFFLIARFDKWQTIQTYYISENHAFWVDGYDPGQPERRYVAEPYPDGFLEDRLIRIWEDGREEPRVEYLSLMSFPESMK